MNIVCTKKDLLKGLSIIESGISSHVTLPILSNFLFETENKKIKLASTNLEIGVKCYIDAKISAKASITLPARKFLGIIKELSDKEDIELKKELLEQAEEFMDLELEYEEELYSLENEEELEEEEENDNPK